MLDKRDIGILDTKIVAAFMKKSNLSQEVLKIIWNISSYSNNKKGLTRDEFFISLRLIALAQNEFPFTKKEIENNEPIPPLPKFTFNYINSPPKINKDNDHNDYDDEDSIYQIPKDNLILYRQYFENNKDSDNYISTRKAIEMWKRNSNNQFNIEKVANSLKPLDKQGFLNMREFQVANHLLSICNCHEIPMPLPNCLLKFLGRPLMTNRPKKLKNKNKELYQSYASKKNNDQIKLNSKVRLNSLPNDISKGKAFNLNIDNNDTNIDNDQYDDIKEFIKDNQNIDNDNNINENISEKDKNVEDKEGNNNNNEKDIKKDLDNQAINESLKDNIINEFKYNINDDSLSKIMKRLENLEKKNNINNDLNNDEIIPKMLKKIDELEKKNDEANSKIASLLSVVDTLKKEKQKMSLEINELKNEFQKMKSQNIQLNKVKKNNLNNKYNTLNTISLNNKNLQNNRNNNSNTNEINQNIYETSRNFERIQKKMFVKREEKSENMKININQNIRRNELFNQTYNSNDNFNNFNSPRDLSEIMNYNLNRNKLNSKDIIPLDGKNGEISKNIPVIGNNDY